MSDYKRRIRDARTLLDRRVGQRDQLEREKRRAATERAESEEALEAVRMALEVVQAVAKETQEQLEYRVSELATLALSGILDNPYEVVLDFETKANNTQAHILFHRDGESVRPMDASGGGAVDIASLALQMTMWSIGRPRTRNLMVLDEPLKWLKGKNMPVKGALMLREMSHRLGVQVLMVSHGPELIDGADNVIEVTHD